MKWIVACVLAVALLLLLPAAIGAARKSARGKGRLGGISLIIGLAFGAMFDPAKAAAIETVRKKKDIGDAESGVPGETHTTGKKPSN